MADFVKLLVVATVLSSALSSAEGDEVALRHVAAIEFPTDLQVHFTERRTSRLLRAPLATRGVAWVEATGDVVMRVHTPRLEERRIEGNRLILRRPSARGRDRQGSPDEAIAQATPRHRTIDLANPTHLGLWAAARVIAGDLAVLENHFAVVATATVPDVEADAWSVELIPRDDGHRRGLKAIRLDGRASQLQRVSMDRGKGRRYELSFAAAAGTVLPHPALP